MNIHFLILHLYSCSTLEGHNGTIWALQQKEEVLISGAHDKTVRDLASSGAYGLGAGGNAIRMFT